jgi:CDGSH-type Zn-finger protein
MDRIEERLDGGPAEQPPKVNVLRLRENGPLAVHAPVRIDGREVGFRVTLCRCGTSKRKPFCDGSHAAAQFVATGEPPTQESAPLAQRDGPLEVVAKPDGPLRLIGALEIVSGTGRTVDRCTEAFLCRCGASSRKPYCDGTHKRIGFKSD